MNPGRKVEQSMKSHVLFTAMLLLAALMAAPVWASWEFEESPGTGYVYLNDDAKLTLPNADFTVGGWFKLDDNTGSSVQNLVLWDDGTGTDACVKFYVREHTNGTDPDKLGIGLRNATNGWNILTSSTTPGTSTEWQHVLLERATDHYIMYVNNVEVANNNYGSYGAVDEDSAWKFSTGTGSSALGGYLAEWAKWESALSSDNRAHLAGVSPGDVGDPCKPSDVGSPVWYCDMYDTTNFDCQVGGLTVTNSGASTNTTPHPVAYAGGGSAPPKVTNPSPAHNATDVSATVDLSWDAAAGATSYDVYLGVASPGAFQGNQAGLAYDPGTLSYAACYYWRIDSKNAYGTTTGDVWSFRTTPIVGSTTGTASGSNVLTIDKPTGVQDNDVLLAFVAFDKNSSITPPSGWTTNATHATNVGDPLSTGVYWKVADASEEPGTYSWSVTGSGYHAGGILCLRGINTSNVIDAATTSATGTNWNHDGPCPSLTTTTANALYLPCFALVHTVTGPTAPSPTATVFSALNGGTAGSNAMVSAATKATAGATGDKLWTLATWDNTAEWHAYQVALRLANPGGSPNLPAIIHHHRMMNQ